MFQIHIRRQKVSHFVDLTSQCEFRPCCKQIILKSRVVLPLQGQYGYWGAPGRVYMLGVKHFHLNLVLQIGPNIHHGLHLRGELL